MTSGHATIFTLAIALGVLAGAVVIPLVHVSAQGGGPHPTCIAAETKCKAEKKEKYPSECPPIINATKCDISKCQGLCVFETMECKGTGCSGNDKGDGDKAGGMPEIPKFEPPKSEPKPPPPEPPCTPTPKPAADFGTTTATTTATSSVLPRPAGGTPCPDSGAYNSWMGSDYLSAGIGGTFESLTDSAGETINNLASDIFSFLGGGGGSSGSSGSGGGGETTGTKDAGKTQTADTTKGGTTGQMEDDVTYEEEEVIEKDGSITIIRRAKEKSTNTGIAGFFGRIFGAGEKGAPAQQSATFFNRLCAARPWQASLVLKVFSTNFFDSLCEKRGLGATSLSGDSPVTTSEMVGRARLTCPARAPYNKEATVEWSCFGSQSAGTGFNTGGKAAGRVSVLARTTTTFQLRCGNTGRASCTMEVGTPRAEIIAHPPRVQLNERARIFWTSDGVTECKVTGPGVSEQGVRGAATTLTILDATTFSIVCKTAEGQEVRGAVIVDVGA